MVEFPKDAPAGPGVYMFKRGAKRLYVGKAVSLKKRLASYFRKKASEKVEALREEADRIEFIETESEIDALLTEAELIKTYYPKYNVLIHNYFYVALTSEQFPKFFITRRPITLLQGRKLNIPLDANDAMSEQRRQPKYIGPFTSSTALGSTLNMLRRIFPYCTCFRPHRRTCLNAQIGRCPGYCCNKTNLDLGIIQNEDYLRSIRSIISVLTGKRHILVNAMKKEMRAAVKNQEFEKAAKLRDQIEGIEDVFRHRPFLRERANRAFSRRRRQWDEIEKTARAALGLGDRPLVRVEGYDISNISGVSATGSMVVFINGSPAKADYRRFQIKTVHQSNDVDMHKEVMRRRISHPEWPYPDLFVIDGGKPQLNAVVSVLDREKPALSSRVVALAKREEELFIRGRSDSLRLDSLPPAVKFFFQYIRDESHRFAKRYHHKLREMSYRPFY